MDAMGSPTASGERRGVLLVGHGTRDPRGAAEFHIVAEALASRLDDPLEACFLELAEPTIHQGVARLAARAIDVLDVVPAMLLAAGHVKRDIPGVVAAAVVAAGADASVRVAEPLECHAKVLELSALRFAETIAGRASVAAEATVAVTVGRGSRDRQATADFARFCGLLAPRVPAAAHLHAFLALAKPSLQGTLGRAAESPGCRRIVVQPHLLFAGELLIRVADAVAFAAARWPHIEWIVAPHLGPHALLVDALEDRSRVDRRSARDFSSDPGDRRRTRPARQPG
jgi:sirohydrochlorin cobaltochelatase